MGNASHDVSVSEIDDGVIGTTHAGGVFGNCLQDRLDIRGRAADYAQDLCRRGLLVQRFAQRTLYAFHLVLQLCVRRRNRRDPVYGRTTLHAELGVRRVVLLTPGTLHAGPPRSWAGEGRKGAASVAPRWWTVN